MRKILDASPGRSAHDAIALVRRRSWEYDWVVEFDIKGLFDHIDHDLLLRAVRKHCSTPWVLLYIERWLRAPMETENGERVARDRGTPQGGVVSSALKSLWRHVNAYLVRWLRRKYRHLARGVHRAAECWDGLQPRHRARLCIGILGFTRAAR